MIEINMVCVYRSHFSILLISLEVKYLASEIAASEPSAQKYLDLKTSSDNEKLLKKGYESNPIQLAHWDSTKIKLKHNSSQMSLYADKLILRLMKSHAESDGKRKSLYIR